MLKKSIIIKKYKTESLKHTFSGLILKKTKSFFDISLFSDFFINIDGLFYRNFDRNLKSIKLRKIYRIYIDDIIKKEELNDYIIIECDYKYIFNNNRTPAKEVFYIDDFSNVYKNKDVVLF